MITTYDFATKTFGHASTHLGDYDGTVLPAVLEELREARKRLAVEYEKMKRGEPYDERFVNGA